MWLSHKAICKSGATAFGMWVKDLKLGPWRMENSQCFYLFPYFFIYIKPEFSKYDFVTHNLPTAL